MPDPSPYLAARFGLARSGGRWLRPERCCRGCGCTDSLACPGGCSWVLIDIDQPTGICSVCAEAVDWDPGALLCVGIED